MLVLSRNQQQKLIIGNQGEIQITVLEIRGNHVRLGIEAPKAVRVCREEIFNNKPAELTAKDSSKENDNDQ